MEEGERTGMGEDEEGGGSVEGRACLVGGSYTRPIMASERLDFARFIRVLRLTRSQAFSKTENEANDARQQVGHPREPAQPGPARSGGGPAERGFGGPRARIFGDNGWLTFSAPSGAPPTPRWRARLLGPAERLATEEASGGAWQGRPIPLSSIAGCVLDAGAR